MSRYVKYQLGYRLDWVMFRTLFLMWSEITNEYAFCVLRYWASFLQTRR
jgi:hypothetical protein